MDREIVWTFRATADLESIVEHIFRDSKFYSTAVARELIAAARSLGTFADRGRTVPEFEDPTVREIIVRRYRLIYRLKPERIEILRIIHGAQQMPPAI